MTGKEDDVCQKAERKCANTSSDSELTACMNLGRAKLAVCKSPDAKTLEDLVEAAMRSNAYELGYKWSRFAEAEKVDPAQLNRLRKIAISSYLTRANYYKPNYLGQIDQFKQRRILSEMPLSMVRSMVAPYLKDYVENGKNPRIFVSQMVQGVLQSPELSVGLRYGFDPTTGEDRGSNATLDAVISILSVGNSVLGGDEIVAQLKQGLKFHRDLLTTAEELAPQFPTLPVDESTHLARIFDGMLPVLSGNARNTLLSLEVELIDLMRRYNQFYGRKTEILPTGSEIFPTRETIFPLLRRHRDSSTNLVQAGNVTELSPVEVQYLLSEPKGIDLPEFVVKVFESIAYGKGWGLRSDEEILDTVLLFMSKNRGEFTSRGLEPRIQAALVGSTNPEVALTIISKYSMGNFGEESYARLLREPGDLSTPPGAIPYSSHWLLTPNILQLLATKVMAGMQLMGRSDNRHFSRSTEPKARSVIKYFQYPVNQSITTIVPVRFSEWYETRLNAKGRVDLQNLPRSQVNLGALIGNLSRSVLKPATAGLASPLMVQTLSYFDSYLGGHWDRDPTDSPIPLLKSLKASNGWQEPLGQVANSAPLSLEFDVRWTASHLLKVLSKLP